MTTLTAKNPSPALGLLATLRRSFGPQRAAVPARQSLPEGAAALFARADAYESTQPSFAADLRAAAHRLLETR